MKAKFAWRYYYYFSSTVAYWRATGAYLEQKTEA